MRVAVDQRRGDPAAFAIEDLVGASKLRRQTGFGTGIDDPLAANGDNAVFDDPEWAQLLTKCGKACIAPEAGSGRIWVFVSVHRCRPSSPIMYIHNTGDDK